MLNEAGPFTIKDLLFNENQDPDHNAIESPKFQPLTYRDLRQQVLSVIKTLNAMGFNRNDRIAVILPDGPETAVMIISVMAGFTSIPLNPQARKTEFDSYFSHLNVKAIVVQENSETAAVTAAKVHSIPVIELVPVNNKAGNFILKPMVSGDEKEAEFAKSSDIVCIYLTSGTTAISKIIPITQKQFFLARQKQCRIYSLTESDRLLHIVPFHQSMSIGHFVNPLVTGGTVICPKDFIPPDFLPLLKTYRPTYYSAVPALHQAILRNIQNAPPEELKHNSLRFIRSGADTLPARFLDEIENLLGVPVIENLGTSETAIISVNIPPKRGSVGIPVIEGLQIIDENGNCLGPCSEGEIIVKGETVFSGYEGAPDENKAAFIDGWFRTGDMGYLDTEGYLFLTGRKKELINKGGRKIAPAEIDTVLLSHPGVREVMTFGVIDSVLGEDVAAMVVPADEKVTETELRTYLLDRLVQFKVPCRIYFVDAIPRNPAGKPLRHEGTKRYS